MDLQLRHHVAVVVGGAAGLGLAIAKAFLDERASVAIIDRDPSTLAIAEQIGASGFVADVTDLMAVERAAENVRGKLNRCDHIVYAAAIGSGKRRLSLLESLARRLVQSARSESDWSCECRSCVSAIDCRVGQGSLLFIASVAGQIGSQTDPPYSASKAGLINFCAVRSA